MHVRPRGQKKPSQHCWQLILLGGIVLLVMLLSKRSGPMEQAHPGSHPCTQEEWLQFVVVFRKILFSPFSGFTEALLQEAEVR